jgi:hypothetical protein
VFLTQRQYPHMQPAVLIGLWTGQREGDVPRLAGSNYDGDVIRLKEREGQRRGKQKNSLLSCGSNPGSPSR